jgi:uncharacterized protein
VNPSRLELYPGVWADSRRAAWFEALRLLAVADLHLGYPWALRHAGLLLPLEVPDDTLPRLASLAADYRPAQIVLVGDVLHRAVPVPAIAQDLRQLKAQTPPDTSLVVITGNHDRNLAQFAANADLDLQVVDRFQLDAWLFVHGEHSSPGPARTVMGHEHPAVRLTDGAARSAKCPCFLVAHNLLVLPAFSAWAAGTVVGSQPFMSDQARATRFERAVAILGNRLLALPMK